MAHTIVGFFETAAAADAAIADIVARGLAEEGIILLAERYEGAQYSHLQATDPLDTSLRRTGMTEREAQSFTQGIRGGGIVVMVTAQDDQIDDVAQIMIAHGAIELEEDEGEPQPVQRGRQREAALPYNPDKPPLRERLGGVKRYVHVE